MKLLALFSLMAAAHKACGRRQTKPNSTKPGGAARADGSVTILSCPGLRAVASRVFLFSFMHGGDPVMTHHFLQHYFQRVGVWPTQSTFVVQHPGNHSLLVETLGELSRAGVRTSNVVVRIERYTDDAKLNATNKFIDTLSPGSLVINADGDELFTYPCSHLHCMQGGSCCGNFQDRWAANLRVAEMRRAPALEEQFPIACNLRGAAGGFKTTKHTLLDPYWHGFEQREPIHFLTSHELGWGHVGARPHNASKFRRCRTHTI